jgi:formamidase
MATIEVRPDPARPLSEQPAVGHNRWHPDIAPVAACAPGDEVVLGTLDALDGQITRDSTAADVASLDIGRVHPLTGPIEIEGAEPGDLLEVDILAVAPDGFGYTCQSTGFGFLRDEFPEPFLVRWEIADGAARSEDLPGVRVPGAPFPGVVGVAPSAEMVGRITARERALADEGGMVDLPDAGGAVPPARSAAEDGLRTIPPRENAGNVDIKQLTAGTRLLLPVWVEGARFSAGDAHFAQGDCETCGQAVEMRSELRVRFGLRKGVAAERGISDLQFEHVPTAPAGRSFVTTGVCVRSDGGNAFEDLTLAARNALRNMIDHLGAEYGYSRQQAYAICSVAVDLRVSQVVDLPNVLVSAFLPLDLFA